MVQSLHRRHKLKKSKFMTALFAAAFFTLSAFAAKPDKDIVILIDGLFPGFLGDFDRIHLVAKAKEGRAGFLGDGL